MPRRTPPLPSSIVIGGRKWTIEVTDKIGARVVDPWIFANTNNIKRGETIWGLTIPHIRRILIAESNDAEDRWKILIHELLHASFPARRVGFNKEESIVYALTPRIVEVFAQLHATRPRRRKGR